MSAHSGHGRESGVRRIFNMKKFLKIHGFQWGHLFVANFWWLFYAASKSWITGRRYMIGTPDKTNFIEVGGSEPNQRLWDSGFVVSSPGHVLWKRIIHYSKQDETAQAGKHV